MEESRITNEKRFRKQKRKLMEAIGTPSPAPKRLKLATLDEIDSILNIESEDVGIIDDSINPRWNSTMTGPTDVNNAFVSVQPASSRTTLPGTPLKTVPETQLKTVDDSGAFFIAKPAALSATKKGKKQDAPRFLHVLIDLKEFLLLMKH